METTRERTAQTNADRIRERIGGLLEKIQTLRNFLRMRRCCLRRTERCRNGHAAWERRIVFRLKHRLHELKEDLAAAQIDMGPPGLD